MQKLSTEIEQNRENRIQSEYKENQSTKVFVCLVIIELQFPFSSWLCRFEIDIEPIFATMALYDLKEKKKVRQFCFIG